MLIFNNMGSIYIIYFNEQISYLEMDLNQIVIIVIFQWRQCEWKIENDFFS